MKRRRYRATYSGIRTSYPYKMGIAKKHVCLENVTDIDTGQSLGDLAMGYGKTFQRLNLRPGDVVVFDARPHREDGYVRLTHPRNAVREQRTGRPTLTLNEFEQKAQGLEADTDTGEAEFQRIRAEMLASRRVIVFRKQFAKMAQDFRAGAMLAQILYWFENAAGTNKPRATFEHDGHLWLNKSRNDWAEELCMSSWEALQAQRKLVDRGLIITRVLQTPWHDSPSTCIRINQAGFVALYKKTLTPL